MLRPVSFVCFVFFKGGGVLKELCSGGLPLIRCDRWACHSSRAPPRARWHSPVHRNPSHTRFPFLFLSPPDSPATRPPLQGVRMLGSVSHIKQQFQEHAGLHSAVFLVGTGAAGAGLVFNGS